MPEIQNPTDGGQGDAAVTTTTTVSGDAGAGDAKKTVTMTQEELDRMIEARLARAKPKDYDDLVALRDRVTAEEQAKKDEATRLKEEKEKAERERDEAISGANQILIRAAIIAEAAAQSAVDADAVAVFLTGDDSIKVEDGKVKGVKPAVTQLLKDKPYLAKPAAGASGGEFGGNDQRTLVERIQEAEGKGDWATARRLKMEMLNKR